MSEVTRKDSIQGDIIHVYDGIEEADNQLPRWWLWSFYLSIAFGIVYWFVYHEFQAADLPMQAYAREMERMAGDDASEELLVATAGDPTSVAEGKQLFQTHCAVCHEPNGAGKIGPNLTDSYWLHGGSPTDIYRVVKEGVLTKGMPAWGPTLGSSAVLRLSAFVMSIQDQNLPGKEPQGTQGEVEAPAEPESGG